MPRMEDAMKPLTKVVLAIALLALFSLPALSQSRDTPAGSSAGSSASSDSRGISSSTTSTPSYTSGSRDYSSAGSISTGGGSTTGGTYSYLPSINLYGTSFSSLDWYYMWYGYYGFLRSRYYLDPRYFSRFYRNCEPLITPELMKLTLRKPMALSQQMLASVDQLELMLQDAQAGKAVDREAIAAKTQEIRELAKQIRRDDGLAYLDRGTNKDLLKGANLDKLGLEAVRQLKEMVTDLDVQLKAMYALKETSTVSVTAFTQPSFESLSKGIEKLSKTIEGSAKKL